MSGGKTKTMCEAVFDMCLDYPGIWIYVARQKHTAITATTRRRFFQVLPAELIDRKKESGGEDWVDVKTERAGVTSRVFFIGMDDPVKHFSSEVGALVFDEAHEFAETDVTKLMSRLRQRCPDCEATPVMRSDGTPEECNHFPHIAMLGFNPENPNHWLRSWFIIGAAQTPFGFYKKELYVTDGDEPIGDCEFVVSRATDNPYNSKRYIQQTLGGMSRFERRRYLEGEWIFVSGHGFFDADALSAYSEETEQPMWVAETAGNLSGADKSDRIRFTRARGGPWAVFRPPVKKTDEHEAHRYIVAVDPSSGGSTDYSGIQVLDVEDFAQVAEFQGKMDPDLVAAEAFRAAAVYNGAVVVVETTGGYGASLIHRIDHELLPRFGGPLTVKPRIYVRRDERRLKKVFTDVMGIDTGLHSRVQFLDTLEQVIRERDIVLRSERTLQELQTFVWHTRKREVAIASTHGKYKPGAQAGENDDLVMSLAIAAYVYAQQPKILRRHVPPAYEPVTAATGY